MIYDLDTLIELESLLGSEALIILRDLHAAGYRVVKYDADKQPTPSPAPVRKYDADEQLNPPLRKFKVGDRVKVLTEYYEGKVGVVILDDGDPEIESPYHVKFENFRYPCAYCAHEIELVQEAK